MTSFAMKNVNKSRKESPEKTIMKSGTKKKEIFCLLQCKYSCCILNASKGLESNARDSFICSVHFMSNLIISGGLVAQAVRRSPPTAGVPSSRLGPSMWVSWWTKRGLGRFFAGFLPFSPTTNFIPPFLHTHLIHFVPLHQPLWWCVRRGRPAPLLLTDL